MKSVAFVLPENEPHIFQSKFQPLNSIISLKRSKFLAYVLLCVNFKFLIMTRDALIQFWKLRQAMAYAVGYSPV